MLRIFLREISMLCWDLPINTEGIIELADWAHGNDGWGWLNSSSLQYRSALVATRMRNIVYSTFDRITSGEVPIRVMAEIL